MTFDVDHSKLQMGIYISGSKVEGDKEIITYDIRTRAPYKSPVMSNEVMHSLEHILAVELEEGFENIDGYDKIYFGPMGCQTGFYLLVASPIGEMEPEEIVAKVLRGACERALKKRIVPFSGRLECGNYKTLEYSREVEGCLRVIEFLAHNVLAHGVSKYQYIQDVSVIANYDVIFGDASIKLRTNELSLSQVEEIAKKYKTSEEFVKAVRDYISSK